MPNNTFKRIEIGSSLLFCGDCFEILPTLDIEADAVISDPPYGNTNCKWDVALPLIPFWEMVKSKTKLNANFVLFACGKFMFDLYNSNPRWYQYDSIWQKNNKVGFLNAKKQPMRNHESILIFGQPRYRDKATYNPQKILGGRKAGTESKNGTNSIYKKKDG